MPRSRRFLAAVLVMVGVIVTTPTPTLRWPDTLPGKLEITIGETVVDVFALGHVLGQRIRIAYGAPNEHGNVLPGSIAFEVDNPDGDYTPDHPMSVYWPDIQLGMTVVWSVFWLGQWWVRFTGQVSEWRPYWPYGDLSNLRGAKGEARVSVVASGLLRQLGQGRSAVRSAVYRTMIGITDDDYTPHEFWSWEDGADATAFAAALPGRLPVTPTGDVLFSVDGPDGSAPLVRAGTGFQAVMPITPYTDVGQWMITFLVNIPVEPAFLTTLFTVPASGGSVSRWELQAVPGSTAEIRWQAYDSGGSALVNTALQMHGLASNPTEDDFFGRWWIITVASFQDGGDVHAQIGFSDGTTQFDSGLGNATPGTHSPLAGPISVNVESALDGIGLGHWAVFTSANVDPVFAFFDLGPSLSGWADELVHVRLERLGRELNIPITIIGTSAHRMGPQQIDTPFNLLAAGAQVDLGILHEDREALALVYRCGSTLYNQSAALTLNARLNELAPPFRPALDDLGVRNDVTIERINGSEYRSVIETGPKSVQPAPDGVGTFDEKLSLNLSTDEQTRFNATWRTWRGTWQGMRYARISPAINAVPSVADSWLTTGLGDLMVVTDLPPQHPPYDVEVLLRGYAEEYTGKTWEVITNASPAGPYMVGIAGDGDEPSAWPQTGDETAIVTALGKGATTVVAHIDGDLFTTDSAELADSPLSVMVGGEVMPVDSIGSSILDRFARSVGAGSWGTSDSGHTYLHTDSAIVSVNGTQGIIALSTINSERHSTASLGVTGFQDVQAWNTLAVTPTGAPINWGILLSYADNGNSYYWADVQVQTSGALTLRLIKRESAISLTQMTTVTAPITHSTSVPRVLRAQYDPSTGVFRSRIWSSDASEPIDTWHLSWVDTSVAPGPRVGVLARLMTGNTNPTPVSFAFDNFELLNPQTFTVQRTLPKTHLPGHPKRSLLSVHRPLIAAH